MPVNYFLGVIRITNFFIACFITFYALLFLTKTKRRNERRPWDYLFVSAIIYSIYQITSLVVFFSNPSQAVWQRQLMRATVEFLYSGLVLLAFISQHDLIIKNPLILISRK